MNLTIEQLTALAKLRRAHLNLEEARRAYDDAEGLCCSMSISLRQIGLIAKTNATAVARRQKVRVSTAHERLAV